MRLRGDSEAGSSRVEEKLATTLGHELQGASCQRNRARVALLEATATDPHTSPEWYLSKGESDTLYTSFRVLDLFRFLHSIQIWERIIHSSERMRVGVASVSRFAATSLGHYTDSNPTFYDMFVLFDFPLNDALSAITSTTL